MSRASAGWGERSAYWFRERATMPAGIVASSEWLDVTTWCSVTRCGGRWSALCRGSRLRAGRYPRERWFGDDWSGGGVCAQLAVPDRMPMLDIIMIDFAVEHRADQLAVRGNEERREVGDDEQQEDDGRQIVEKR